MAQFVQQHRNKQQQGGEQPHEPADPDHASGLRHGAGHLLLKRHREQHQDDEPAGVNPEGDPTDTHQLPAITHVLFRREWPVSLGQS